MADFHLLTIDWYRQNMRDLPWRRTNDPYLIWLSEIILQQTRVEQGLNYYLKFTENFPTVYDLANADEQTILNLWQGLGYYSRARNLHWSAKQIVSEYKGVFPNEFKTLKNLKGVGDYTAAAIASFSFNLPHAVVDGNVYRVLSRVFDIDIPIDSSQGKKYFASLAQELLPIDNPAEYNQSIMEFGALQCTPLNPKCDSCPLESSCLSKANNTIANRPVKEGKTKVRNRFFHFLIFEENNETVVEKRTEKDIWQHLYQFPLVETSDKVLAEDFIGQIKSEYGVKPVLYSKKITHILSHQKINATFYHFDKIPVNSKNNWITIDRPNLADYPIPRLIDRYLENEKS